MIPFSICFSARFWSFQLMLGGLKCKLKKKKSWLCSCKYFWGKKVTTKHLKWLQSKFMLTNLSWILKATLYSFTHILHISCSSHLASTYTIGALYTWAPHPWIEPSLDQKYSEKKKEHKLFRKFQKTKLILLWMQYLHSIYIVLDITGREGNGTPLLHGKSHGRRSLVGRSPWGC